jgi:hypothetical protein
MEVPMMQTGEGVREKQFNLRLSAEEWESVETLCAHYGVNAAALVRMLVKREVSAVGGVRPLRLTSKHEDVLKAVGAEDGESVNSGEIALTLSEWGHAAKGMQWLGRVLNELRRAALIKRAGDGFVLTDAGQAALAKRA